jgi:hypothetical protein
MAVCRYLCRENRRGVHQVLAGHDRRSPGRMGKHDPCASMHVYTPVDGVVADQHADAGAELDLSVWELGADDQDDLFALDHADHRNGGFHADPDVRASVDPERLAYSVNPHRARYSVVTTSAHLHVDVLGRDTVRNWRARGKGDGEKLRVRRRVPGEKLWTLRKQGKGYRAL